MNKFSVVALNVYLMLHFTMACIMISSIDRLMDFPPARIAVWTQIIMGFVCGLIVFIRTLPKQD